MGNVGTIQHMFAQDASNRSAMTDKQLIDLCAKGDERAMAVLHSRYKARVFAVAYRIAGASLAEEAMQESFVRIFRGLSKFRGDSALSTWVYRLTVNTSLSLIAKRKKHWKNRTDMEKVPVVACDAPKQDSKLQGTIERCIQSLPKGYRTVLVLHDIQGLSHEECAAVMGCRVGTSKSQLYKARMKMRTLLAEAGVS